MTSSRLRTAALAALIAVLALPPFRAGRSPAPPLRQHHHHHHVVVQRPTGGY